jgi:hypothetical protein
MIKRILIVTSLALSLGACTQLQTIETAFKLGTASVANPVTKPREAQIEAAFDTALQLLLAYRRACVAGTADVHCKANIALIQPYTRQAKVLIGQLRQFVDTNDQVNATVIFNQLTTLYADMKSTAAIAGVNVGNLP